LLFLFQQYVTLSKTLYLISITQACIVVESAGWNLMIRGYVTEMDVWIRAVLDISSSCSVVTSIQ